MKVEQVGDEVVIRMKGDASSGWLKDLLDYLRYKELMKDVQVPQEEIDAFAREVKQHWWAENRHRFEP